MRRYLAVLLVFILMLSTSASVFAQGKVEVQHFDVSNLVNVDEIGEKGLDRDTVADEWAKESLNTTPQAIVIKNAAYGTDNWSGNAGEDAFLRNQGGTEKNAQKIYGYLAPTEDVTSLAITVDDGLRLKIDENQDESFEANELLIDEYHIQGATTYTVNVDLEAGKDYKFEIHYFNWGGHGAIEFKANGNDMDLDWFRTDKRPTAPIVSNVHIEIDGEVATEAKIGDRLEGTYDFYDAEDNSDESGYKWYVDGVEQENTTDTLDVTEDMVNKKIEFEVTAKTDEEPMLGNTEKSNDLEVLEPNLWLTVDDGYKLYINGEFIGEDPAGGGLPHNDSWKTIDYYYVDDTDAAEILIAVEGNDQGDGQATIAGLVLGYKDSGGNWLISDDQWKIYTNDDRTAPADYDNGESIFKWYEAGYHSNDWMPAHLITNPDGNWPDEHPYLFDAANAQWIWSDDYKDEPFDSPVFFRTMVNTLQVNNHAPSIQDESLTTDKDTAVSFIPTTEDIDGDSLELTIETQGEKGIAVVNDDGSITYTPNENENGDDSFIVLVDDGKGGTNTAIIDVTINPVNEGPVMPDQNFEIDEDDVLNANISFSDPEEDDVTLEILTGPTNGSLILNNSTGAFTYTPIENYNGEDSFIVKAVDEYGAETTAIITITINPGNDAPTITEETFVTDEDTPITDAFEVNDVDGDVLEITIVNSPSDGILVLDEEYGFTYTPNAEFNGTDTFEVKVSDGTLESTGTMTVNVVSVEDIPLAVDDQVSTDENQRITIDVLRNDLIGDSETLEITNTTAPSKGSISITENNNIIYTPNTNQVGSDSFTYEVTGGSVATVNITINPVNDEDDNNDGGGGGGFTPSNNDSINAVTDNLITIINQPIVTNVDELLANDEDADEITSVENGGNGTVSINGDEITFTPTAEFIGRAYYYYTAENDSDESDRGTVIVTVEEGTTIEPNETPLGGGNEDEMILINPEIVPLGTIDFSDPYIYGYPDDTFRPERSVTRAEIATIVARILKLDLMNTGEAIYNDVHPDNWFYNYIQAASHLEIFNGYADGTFKPNQPVTHGEMAAIFSKYWEVKNIELPNEQVPYSDVENHWAEKHISRFYNAGVSVGFIDDTFRPNAFTKRTELVVMVNRIIDRPNLEQEIPSFTDVSKEFWGYEAIEAATEGFVPLEQ